MSDEQPAPAPEPKPPKPRPPGRPSKLTPEVQAEICSNIAGVCTFEEACVLANVDRSTAQRWLIRGEAQKRGKFRAFVTAVNKAKVQHVAGLKAAIRIHGRRDWRALQALGAMTNPKQFIPQVRVHIETQIDGILDALQRQFQDRQEIYAEALHAVVGAAEQQRQLEAGNQVVEGEVVADTPASGPPAPLVETA